MTKTFDTLYARDSKGKVLKWDIEVQSRDVVDIQISYGEFDGGQTITWQKARQGKNIGKANETNAYEQAVLEAESKIRLQKKKGYMSFKELNLDIIPPHNSNNLLVVLQNNLPKNRTDAQGDVKPMKAQQYYRSKKNWIDPNGEVWSDRKYYYLLNPYVRKELGAIITKFPCIGQPKINGVRATTRYTDKAVIKSKEGKEYNVAQINDFFNLNPDIFVYGDKELVLDGELYIHGELLQDIGSAINKPNLNTPRVTYRLFDIAIEGYNNLQRWEIIKEHIKPKLEQHFNCPIEIIETVKITGDAAAQAYTDKCIKEGYEGAIFRQFTGMYAFGKRPQAMTKLKRTISHEFRIIDVIPQDVDDSKGNFVCITPNGLRFNVNPKGNDEFKRSVLYKRTEVIGKQLTCDFYEWTKDGKPFHILNNTIRDYE